MNNLIESYKLPVILFPSINSKTNKDVNKITTQSLVARYTVVINFQV